MVVPRYILWIILWTWII